MGEIQDRISLQTIAEKNSTYGFPVPGDDSNDMEKHKDHPCVNHQE